MKEIIRLEKAIKDGLIDEEKVYDAAKKGRLDFFVPIKKGKASSFLYKRIAQEGGNLSELVMMPSIQEDVEALGLSAKDCEDLYLGRNIKCTYFPIGLTSLSSEDPKIITAEELYESSKPDRSPYDDVGKQSKLDFSAVHDKDKEKSSQRDRLDASIVKGNYELFDDSTAGIGADGKLKKFAVAPEDTYFGLGIVKQKKVRDLGGKKSLKRRLLEDISITESKVFVLKSQIEEFLQNSSSKNVKSDLESDKDIVRIDIQDLEDYEISRKIANSYIREKCGSVFDKVKPGREIYDFVTVAVFVRRRQYLKKLKRSTLDGKYIIRCLTGTLGVAPNRAEFLKRFIRNNYIDDAASVIILNPRENEKTWESSPVSSLLEIWLKAHSGKYYWDKCQIRTEIEDSLTSDPDNAGALTWLLTKSEESPPK